jgi:anti-anti-sigma factor
MRLWKPWFKLGIVIAIESWTPARSEVTMDCQISVRGEIDMANCPDLLAEFHRAIVESDADIVVDCAQLTFIDATGIRACVNTQRVLEAQGRDFRLLNVRPGPRRAIEILGLTELLTSGTQPGLLQRQLGY